jgi:hypothetical protein
MTGGAAHERGDTLSILREGDGKTVGKVWTQSEDGRWAPQDYGRHIVWNYESASVDSVRSFYDLVRQLGQLRDAVFIRGRGIPGRVHAYTPGQTGRQQVRRRSKGKDAFFEEQPLRSLMIDADKVVVTAAYDLTRAEDRDRLAGDVLREVMPSEWWKASFGYQLSSSTGAGGVTQLQPGDRASVHYFFWLSEPRTNAELKRYLRVNAVLAAAHDAGSGKLSRGVDPAILNPVQPNYVADPVFQDWRGQTLPDPLPARWGFVDGETDVVTITIPTVEVQQKIDRARREAGQAVLHAETVEEALATLGAHGMNQPIWSAMYVWMKGHPTGMPTRDEMAAFCGDIRRRLLEAYPGMAASSDPYIAERYRKYFESDALEDMLQRTVLNIGVEQELPDYWQPRARVSLAEARKKIREAVGRFVDQHEKFERPVMVIRSTPGTGKTRTTFEALRPLAESGRMIGYAVPHHRLSGEALETAGYGRVWYGLEKLCRPEMLETATKVAGLGLSVPKHVCDGCAFATECAYREQYQHRADRGLMFYAHQLLARPVREEEIVVIDEGFWKALLREAEIPVEEFAVGTFRDWVPDENGLRNSDATALLGEMRKRIVDCFEGDALSAAHLRRVGITRALADDLAGFESYRREFFEESFDLNRIDRHAAANGANANRHRRFWKLVSAALDKDHPVVPGVFRQASGDILLTWTDDIEDAVGTSFLILDGTADRKILERFFPPYASFGDGPPTPRIEWIDVDAEIDQTAEVVLCSDWSGSKTSQKTDGGDLSRRMKKVERTVMAALARGRTVSAITNVGSGVGPSRDAGYRRATMGSTVGLNEFWENDWKTEEHIVVGRTMPPADGVERSAEGVFGVPVLRGQQYQKTTRIQEIRRGRSPGPESNRRPSPEGLMIPGITEHPDPYAEAIRRQVADAALEQDVHRARLALAGPNRCVRVFAADVWLDMPVDRRARFEEMVDDELGVMAARGVIPTTKAGLAAMHPDLFPTEKAADNWLGRELDLKRLKGLIREMRLSSARYQRPGRGARPFKVWFSDLEAAASATETLGADLLSVEAPARENAGASPATTRIHVVAPADALEVPPAYVTASVSVSCTDPPWWPPD